MLLSLWKKRVTGKCCTSYLQTTPNADPAPNVRAPNPRARRKGNQLGRLVCALIGVRRRYGAGRGLGATISLPRYGSGAGKRACGAGAGGSGAPAPGAGSVGRRGLRSAGSLEPAA